MKQYDMSVAPALHNGLEVIELLGAGGEDIGFNQIAVHLGVSKATTSRVLKVLRTRGYVVKDQLNGRYRPGPRMSVFGNSLPAAEILRRGLPAVLESLLDKVSNTVLFIFWNGHELQCLAKKTHQSSVPMQEVGHLDSDLTAGPWGWLVYDSLDDAGRREAEARMRDTLDWRPIFDKWSEFFKKNGFCYDDQELYRPLRRLAAPVHGADGLVGALGIGGNPLTIKNVNLKKFGKILKEHAAVLSASLGNKDSNLNRGV
ncbi:MAG: helix-turn-helix domain-containing protein [Victivallales bacterium]|nr:helix-turn-helix domain-containing protein [Victivallales bacterium]